MKILAFSDIHFPSVLFKKNKESEKKYFLKENNELKNLTTFIKSSKIELVLLAGDVMGDLGKDVFFGAFSWLVEYLEENEVTTYYIQGNHDIDESYLKLSKSTDNNNYVKDISGKLINYNGLKILGLSFFDTENKTKLKKIISQKNKIDILLCHCQNGRRPFLFEFDTKYIITGHFDRQFYYIENKVFISFQGSESYSIIEFKKKSNNINLYENKTNDKFFDSNPNIWKAVLKNENIVWKSDSNIPISVFKNKKTTSGSDLQTIWKQHFEVVKYFNSFGYSKAFESCIPLLLKIKSDFKATSNISDELKIKCKENRFNIHIPVSTQTDFLGQECHKKLNSKS